MLVLIPEQLKHLCYLNRNQRRYHTHPDPREYRKVSFLPRPQKWRRRLKNRCARHSITQVVKIIDGPMFHGNFIVLMFISMEILCSRKVFCIFFCTHTVLTKFLLILCSGLFNLRQSPWEREKTRKYGFAFVYTLYKDNLNLYIILFIWYYNLCTM